jgi:hypothetical protein
VKVSVASLDSMCHKLKLLSGASVNFFLLFVGSNFFFRSVVANKFFVMTHKKFSHYVGLYLQAIEAFMVGSGGTKVKLCIA